MARNVFSASMKAVSASSSFLSREAAFKVVFGQPNVNAIAIAGPTRLLGLNLKRLRKCISGILLPPHFRKCQSERIQVFSVLALRIKVLGSLRIQLAINPFGLFVIRIADGIDSSSSTSAPMRP